MAQRRLLSKHDAHDIETNMVPICAGVARIVASRGHNAPFLLRIDRAVRRSIVGARPGLHLHEHNDVSITGDDVDLTTQIGRPIVTCQDDQAGLPEVAVRKVFPSAAQRRVGVQQLPLFRLAEGIAQAPEALAPKPTMDGEAALGLIASSVHSITFPRTM